MSATNAGRTKSRTTAPCSNNNRNQNLENCKMIVDDRQTYPFEDEKYKSSHHWLIWTEILILRISCILLPIIGPASPGSKHHYRSLWILWSDFDKVDESSYPYDDHNINTTYDWEGKLEDSKEATFSTAYLTILSIGYVEPTSYQIFTFSAHHWNAWDNMRIRLLTRRTMPATYR